MKKFFYLFFVVLLITIILVFSFASCGTLDMETHSSANQHETNQNGEPYQLSFIAEFYDNAGQNWLTTQGSRFNISPNKVKEYYWDSDGSWISGWTMSSIVSVDIDGNNIETCGSTVLIYDNYLVKQECVLPEEYVNTASDGNATVDAPYDLRSFDAWTVNWWWMTKDFRNYNIGEKIVIIQSQEGNPICLFSGDNVSWEVSRNLPKTTELTIDGAKLYIHRANFAIIDKSLFNGES